MKQLKNLCQSQSTILFISTNGICLQTDSQTDRQSAFQSGLLASRKYNVTEERERERERELENILGRQSLGT